MLRGRGTFAAKRTRVGLAHTAKPLGGCVMPARLSSGASRGAAWDRDALVSAARHSACVVLDQCRCDLTQQLGRALDEEDAVMLLRSSSYFERSPALLAATEARRDALEASVADLLGTAWRGIESLLHDSLSTLAERVEHAAREELSERVMTTNKTLSFTHTLSTRPLSPQGARLEAGIESTRRTAELRERQECVVTEM